MNSVILNTEIQNFIVNNTNTDLSAILLTKSPFENVTSKELVQQLEAREKCRDKLPTWYATPGIYYPNKIHVEQSSSEITAAYKADLLKHQLVLDATAGLGVDSYFFARTSEQLHYCETNAELYEIAIHNFMVLGVANIKPHLADGMDFIKKTNLRFDLIYLDPSRRNMHKGKVFMLKDYSPDVTEQLSTLFRASDMIMIKTAPLLDITSGIRELSSVKEIHVVAVHNEVKELVWILENGYEGSVLIKTVNHQKNAEAEHFEFEKSEEQHAQITFSKPDNFLYEPNAAIMKSGGFKIIADKMGLHKLHEHSHLYTHSDLLEFPGRRFRIENTGPFSRKNMSIWKNKNANITIRNFPDTVARIRKKYQIKDGGNKYLFLTKDLNEQHVLLECTKV